MSYYYDYNVLAHYGVSGQKWGVRRYQNKDGSLTQLGKEHYGVSSENSDGNKKFTKKYERETKKLQKYEERADLSKQAAKAITYDSNAKKLKAVGRGALAVALPSAAVSGMTTKDFNYKAHKDLYDINRHANVLYKQFTRQKNNSTTIYDYDLNKTGADVANAARTLSLYADRALPSTKLHAGATTLANVAGVTAAVAYGASAYNKLQSSLAKHRLTDKGHAKAVARRDAQYQKITNMVKGTSYMSLFKDQIDAYKKEHPNTELSDKQIMKNLM